ncbi:hypothetical protein PMG11_11135 [Penicillium brasilianum]|uniref:Uncharacterized protein n=1 Tax=Penicillium brasilianum TaxID=104259 RepID=A0A0F7U4I6_PENBI|nr:hypothetical protein PMG11_11135 [Penicillium brasilianum]
MESHPEHLHNLPRNYPHYSIKSLSIRCPTPKECLYKARGLTLVSSSGDLMARKKKNIYAIFHSSGEEREIPTSISYECPTRFAVHAELQLVRFYDENPQRIPPFRFIGVSKKSCYLCDRFLANHPLSFSTSACHQKLYSSWAPPSTGHKIIFNSYKSIIRNLISTMEAAIKQDIDRRLQIPHKVVPPDSSAGVSLTGITEPNSVPVMSGALVESRTCKRPILQEDCTSRNCYVEQADESESLFSFSAASHSIRQPETSDLDDKNQTSSDCGIVSKTSPLWDKLMSMVLHFKRADNSLNQEIVRVAEILDAADQQPSWEMLIDILNLRGFGRVNFDAEKELLVVENHITIRDRRQLLACLQYLYNSGKVNGHGLVYDRNTIEHAGSSSLAGGAEHSTADNSVDFSGLESCEIMNLQK